MNRKLVSIIITTKNEAGVIENLFVSIQKQSFRHIETVLVDNYSTDRTREIARKYTKRIYTKGPERSSQRNFGALKARGGYIFFLDADMTLEENVVSECVKRVDEKNIAGVIVPEISFGTGFWANVKAFERSFYIGDEKIEAARFFIKTIFSSVGGFDEEITGPEDWELSDRIRKRFGISRIRSHILHNEGSLRFGELMRKKYYYGKKTPVYLRKVKKTDVFSAKTIFFLRTSFYKKPIRILSHPVLFCAMILMLTSELIAGIFGVIAGSFNDKFLEK